ncbi:Indigoidine synthase A like protein-domain-containing protein [Podospora conica]|nr:Indigoidine synthase A like protein-domain-containing protein [Schizothecium conicum]
MATARLLSSRALSSLRTKPRLPQTRLPNRARHHSTKHDALRSLLKVSPEVADAVATNKPVVALESTIYTHGALGDDLLLEDIVRRHGAVPAVCGILDGVPCVGLDVSEVARMVSEGARKASRRDLAYVVGTGLAGPKLHAGTTIAGTMVLARLAGIRVFGTGGLGGVHQGGHNSLDISADLTELGRTRMAVVSAGCKGFLDIPRTLEFLETHGAMVSTFADGRKGDVDFPAFWARESGTKSPFVIENESQAAAIILAQEQLGIESGMLFANPIPEEHAIPRAEMEEVIRVAVREADEKGFTGSRNTPYVLTRIRQLTNERSVTSNKYLVQANVARAAKVAVELSKLLAGTTAGSDSGHTIQIPSKSTFVPEMTNEPVAAAETQPSHTVDVLVAGSVALDLSCDYMGPHGPDPVSPALHTSNPSSITQTVGGVGHNVALAAHYLSDEGRVRLCSLVGDDIAGSTILTSLAASGLDTSYIRRLGHEYPSTRTAQYVSVNDTHKALVLAMADMAIFSQHSFPTFWASAVAASAPKWLVLDANWSAADMPVWLRAARGCGARVAYEPVSREKARRLFDRGSLGALGTWPAPSVEVATPNQGELGAMYEAAREGGFLEAGAWFEVVDGFGIHGGARERFVDVAGKELTDEGVPVQAMQLLPYVPTVCAKLGAKGVLVTMVLKEGDWRLRDPEMARWIVARGRGGGRVGGVYMRLFGPAEKVGEEEVVSVNGVGDTFLGVLVAGLARGGEVDGLVDVAQKAAVLSLKSREAVSLELVGLKRELMAAVEGCKKR